uniref:Uncharacterized protein n=1 Tax=Arundo donax TaxID=35708 RepID=A0A0A8YTC1_ARUDO
MCVTTGRLEQHHVRLT